MLADVSHELRTPLTAMRGYLDTLAMPDVALDPATRARYLETARREAERLQRSSPTCSTWPGTSTARRRSSRGCSRSSGSSSTSCGVTSATPRPPASRSPRRVARTPTRCSPIPAGSNRRWATWSPTPCATRRRAATIRLEAAVRGGQYRLTVEDSGDGIPAAHLAHVFDRFYKADSARTGGHGGSGLGLSIVKAIVERHGGTIAVESRPGRHDVPPAARA